LTLYHDEMIDIRTVLRRAEFSLSRPKRGRVRVRGSIKIMPANLLLQQKHPLENYGLLTPALSSFGEERECWACEGLEFFPTVRILTP